MLFGLVASAFCLAPILWWRADYALAFWPLAFAACGFVLTALALVTRHHAWIAVVPNEARVRVVRLHAWSYSAATLTFSEAMAVECAPVGDVMWLYVVARDGRAARVLPASAQVVDEVEAFLKSSDTRPGIPSPR